MSSRKTICIIDDDKIYTYGVSKIVRKSLSDHHLISFENGQEALEGINKIKENNEELPDLILLDIAMPKMNGWDFLNEFQDIREKLDKEIQIFVISSQIQDRTEELFRLEWDEKVSDFIRKPVDVEALMNILK